MTNATATTGYEARANFQGAWTPAPGRTPKAAAKAFAAAAGVSGGVVSVRRRRTEPNRVTYGFDAWAVGGALRLTPRGSGVIVPEDRAPLR